MSDIKGSKTEKNLQEAFAGESQARNKYTYFASVAKKEGYEKIAQYFSKQQKMRRSMPSCILSISTALAQQLIT